MTGLLTFHWADDYGALLQAYALKRRLEELAGQVEVIPYAPLRLKGRYHWFALRYKVVDAKPRFQMLRSVLSWLRRPIPDPVFVRRRRAMARFRQRYLAADCSLRKARDIPLERYSSVFVGSDQIWNPEITVGLDDAYIGAVPGPGRCRLTAYAASLGGRELPEAYRERFSACVGRGFADLSLREQEAVPFVEQALHRKAAAVLDPTLLLTRQEWEEIAVPPEEEGYVLVYQTEYSEPLLECARRIAQKRGRPVVSVSYYRRDRTPAWAERRADIGPAEFVGYVQHAACVVTNSFHGAVFSILYEKPFLAFPHSTTSARVENLLNKLGLQDRLVTERSPAWEEAVWEPSHWLEVSRRLEEEREGSLAFLRQTLKGGDGGGGADFGHRAGL